MVHTLLDTESAMTLLDALTYFPPSSSLNTRRMEESIADEEVEVTGVRREFELKWFSLCRPSLLSSSTKVFDKCC